MTPVVPSHRISSFSPVSSLSFFLILAATYAIWIWYADQRASDTPTVLWFACIGIVSLAMLAIDISRHPYSLVSMGWAFLFLFVGVAGTWQFVNDAMLYSDQLATNSTIHAALFAISLWIVFLALGVWLGSRQLRAGQVVPRRWDRPVGDSGAFVVAATLFSLAIVTYLLSQGGADMLLSREATGAALKRKTLAETQLTAALRNFPLYIFALSALYSRKTGKLKLLVAAQLLLVLLSNSPLAIPRFNVAVVYLGLLLLLLPSFGKGVRFIATFLGAFILVFPFLSIFRRAPADEMSAFTALDKAGGLVFGFDSGDYDTFSMIAYTIAYLSDFGSTFGYQLLGPLMFFVPRTIWPDKPIGTGAHILTAYGYDFTNGSGPLVAEGLINFGLAGVLLFATIFGYLSAKLDRYYWTLSRLDAQTPFKLFYPFMIPLYFFMNRGDLLSSFGYGVSHFVAFATVLAANNFLSLSRDGSSQSRSAEASRAQGRS